MSWQKGVRVTLAANDGYWRGRPPFKTVTFQVVPDTATRIANLKTGRSDIIRQLNPDDAASLKGESRLQILSIPTERTGYLFINALYGPTKDVRVRRAIAHAINRPLLVDALFGGYGRPVNILLTPANFGYVEGMKGYPFDPARARQLLKEAGAEGAEISFYTSPAYDQRLVQAIQQMLQEVGLKVAISQTDHPTFLKRRQGKPEEAGSISLGRWSCACQDADGVIFPLFQSQSLWAKYANPAFDDAVDAGPANPEGRGTAQALPRGLRHPRAGRPGDRPLPGLRDLRRAARARVEADRERGLLRDGDEVAVTGGRAWPASC